MSYYGDDDYPFHAYCYSKDITLEGLKKKLLEEKVDPNQRDDRNLTPLHKACLNHQLTLEMLKLLVESKAEINVHSDSANTPMHFLVGTPNNLEKVKYLLDNKASVNYVNENRYLPITNAMEGSGLSLELVKLLVEAKSELNVVNLNTHEYPLMLGCKNEKITLDIIKYLVENKSDVNAEYEFNSILNKVMENKNLSTDAIIYLVNSKASVNNYVFHEACRTGDVQLIKMFIEYKCDPNSTERGNNTLFKVCYNEKNPLEVAKYLIEEHKVDIHTKTKTDETLLHHACETSNSFELVKYLVESKLDLNSMSKSSGSGFGQQQSVGTPFLFACSNERFGVEELKYLVEKKANIHAQGTDKLENAVYSVCSRQNPCLDSIKFLVENKVDIAELETKSENSPLHPVLEYPKVPSLQVVDFLVRNKADIHKKETSYKHLLPFEIACYNRSAPFEVIKCLAEAKSNVDNALRFIQSRRDTLSFEVVKYFIEMKADTQNTYKTDVFDILCANDQATLEMMRFMVDHKVSLDKDCLVKACENVHCSLEAVKFLVDSKADINKEIFRGNVVSNLLKRQPPLSPNEAQMMFIHCYFAGFNVNLVTPKDCSGHPEVSMLIERTKNHALWSPEVHQHFPLFFQRQIFTLMLCFASLLHKQIFPKPLLKMICGRLVELHLSDLRQKLSLEKQEREKRESNVDSNKVFWKNYGFSMVAKKPKNDATNNPSGESTSFFNPTTNIFGESNSFFNSFNQN